MADAITSENKYEVTIGLNAVRHRNISWIQELYKSIGKETFTNKMTGDTTSINRKKK